MTTGKTQSLQEFIDSKANLADHFYNDTVSPHTSYRRSLSPAPQEWSNWRDEQRAWRETAVLFDQSHHMPEIFLKGPDAEKMLSHIGVNSLAKLEPGKARQFVGCNTQGQMIGECVVYCHGKNDLELVSGMHFQNWIKYHADSGKWDVNYTYDPPTNENPKGRVRFRFGMDGPNAETIFREVIEGEAPAIPFFNHIKVKIAGCDCVALRHGMAGHKGVELSGSYKDYDRVREAVLKVGEKYGLRPGGVITYFTAVSESGWLAYPTPAVFTDPGLADYRKKLPADSWEVNVNIGGSFYSDNIEDYYVTPWDMGYDKIVNFDHDFIGREALEKAPKKRTCVFLIWNHDDIMKVHRSMYSSELPFKFMNYPVPSYAFQQTDMVLDSKGQMVGISTNAQYTTNERELVSIAMVDRELATPGTELVLIWGEPNGGSRKKQVERHRQTEIRVRVESKPYSKVVKAMKNASLG